MGGGANNPFAGFSLMYVGSGAWGGMGIGIGVVFCLIVYSRLPKFFLAGVSWQREGVFLICLAFFIVALFARVFGEL